MYSRETKRYTLDEIIFIICALKSGYTLSRLSEKVQRSPEAIKYKFLTYRQKKNGKFSNKTVAPYEALQ